ncbi:hypothetical protein [Arthrobacter sp. PsM3]|uniref:hypothetical protein n=1 Tax=Arthrobacter sp. PsM3 TaxID=3030531 RepID=UPI00263A91BF|nr:hypothetical protein [Arthrobacter sp. PsM3]MDN4644960.1 hypothetical protein [Arthrobacter sp. PsM3]
MKITAEPRSDQWNADDFTGGPRTFTVSGVKDGAAEQKYDIELVEGEGRAWRPPLGMLRVLMNAWGDEADAWIGRRVTLFKDANVRFGKEVPGGIRISHLSHIGTKPLNVPITVARGQRRTYTVQPLPDAAPVTSSPDKDWKALADGAAGDPTSLRAIWDDAKASGADDATLTYIRNSAKEPNA